MDIATLGIVVDPRATKEGSDQVKSELKSILVTAEQTQKGVVAAFQDTASKRLVLIRDSQAANANAERQQTSVTAEEALRRIGISGDEAARRAANTQARLAASKAAMDAESAAEMEAGRRASEAVIAAASATKENALAAIEAVRAARAQDAREALEAAKSSAEGQAAALKEVQAAYKQLSEQEKQAFSGQLAAAKAAADESAAVQKEAIKAVAEADKAAQAEMREQQKQTAAAQRTAQKARTDAEREASQQVRQTATAAAEAERGWTRFERGAVSALATMGLIAPQANTALVAIQALTGGMELLGAGVAVATGLIAALLAIAAGIAGLTVLFFALKEAANLEPLENQLANAAGSFKNVEAQMRGIQAIEREAGGLFKLPNLVEATRDLALFSEGALTDEKSLRLVADAAAAVGKPVDQVAAAVGKLYGAVQAGAPIDRYAKALVNLRLINEDVLVQMSNAQKAGASPADIWAKAMAALQGYSGAMEQYGRTLEGTLGRMRIDIGHTLEEFARPLLPLIEPRLRAVESALLALGPVAENVGKIVAGAIIGGQWDQVAQYIGLRVELGLNMAFDKSAEYFTNTFSKAVDDFVAGFSEKWQEAVERALKIGTLGMFGAGAGGAEAATGAGGAEAATSGSGASGRIGGDPYEGLRAQIAELAATFRKSSEDAIAAMRGDGKLPAAPAGTGETLDRSKAGGKVRDDATVMADFIEQLNELTYKMQQRTVSRDEFSRRRDQLQSGTVKELGDPSHANDIYSDPRAADRTWSDILNKWKVMQEERTRVAAQADERIKTGEASMVDALVRGFQKVSEQWGTVQQQISKGIEDITQAITRDIGSAMADWITGTKDAKTAFADMAKAILGDIVRICTQLLIQMAIQAAIKALGYGGGGSVGGFVAGSGGSTFGADARASAAGGNFSASPSGGGGGGGGIGSPVEPDLPTGGGGLDVPTDPLNNFAGGGGVWGGNGGIDDIPARLTRGEYVMPVDTVAHYGTHFMDALRRGSVHVRGFAAGGAVPGPVTGGGRGGAGDSFSIAINVDAGRGGTKGTTDQGGQDPAEVERLKKMAAMIESGTRKIIQQEKRPGGLLNNGGNK